MSPAVNLDDDDDVLHLVVVSLTEVTLLYQPWAHLRHFSVSIVGASAQKKKPFKVFSCLGRGVVPLSESPELQIKRTANAG